MHQDVIKRFSEAQNSLVIQQSDFSLSAIYEMVQNQSIDLFPHYQRRDRWNSEKQSALIESFLLNVPIPPVYLSEDNYGEYSVIDGKQRITAIYEFLNGNLKLKNLKEFSTLDGYGFNDLPEQLRRALTIRPYIRVITLLKQSDPEIKYEVFLRLNTGGEKLRPQEIRNVAYSGSLNDLLFELAEHPFLKTSLKISSNKSVPFQTMDDVEHVLRFLTVFYTWQDPSGKLSDRMDRFMAEHRYSNTDEYKFIFHKAIEGCQSIWGQYAFKKFVSGTWREQFISPLFDAQMAAVASLTDSEIQILSAQQNTVIDTTVQLFEENEEFLKSISQSTNNASAISTRISSILTMLNNI